MTDKAEILGDRFNTKAPKSIKIRSFFSFYKLVLATQKPLIMELLISLQY